MMTSGEETLATWLAGVDLRSYFDAGTGYGVQLLSVLLLKFYKYKYLVWISISFSSSLEGFLCFFVGVSSNSCQSCRMDKECIISPSFSIPLNGSLVGYFKGGEGD